MATQPPPYADPPALEEEEDDDVDVDSPLLPPPRPDSTHSIHSSSSSSSSQDTDEGWATVSLPPPGHPPAWPEPPPHPHGSSLACRILHLELPTLDAAAFLGIEKEELLVTCQVRGGGHDEDDDEEDEEEDGMGVCRVASTRVPSSYRPTKGQVCWDQKLDLPCSLISGRRRGALHFMLWSSSTLLGQAEFPLRTKGEDATGLQRLVLPFLYPGGSSSRGRIDRRGSTGVAPSPSSSSSFSSRKQHQQPLWRRTVSEPVAVASHSEASPTPASPAATSPLSPTPFPWPTQGNLVFEVLVSSTSPPPSASSTHPTPSQLLQRVLARPSDALSLDEARLVWTHRHGLVPQQGSALVKLLRALILLPDFRHEVETDNNNNDSILYVLQLWRDHPGSVLSTLDAMKLLGAHFPHPAIRALGIETLAQTPDDELRQFLLQLVQLLRYEGDGRIEEEKEKESSSQFSLPMHVSPLAKLLIERSCRTVELANALFWYLATEMHDKQGGNRAFETARFAFLYALREENEAVYVALSAQETWFKKLAKVHQRVLDAPGLRERKQALLRELLVQDGVVQAPMPVPLPIDPSLVVTHLDPASACVYGSKTYPAFITFLPSSSSSSSSSSSIPLELTEKEEVDDASVTHLAESRLSGATDAHHHHHFHDLETQEEEGKVLIFKCREDVRQDQLVLQLISLMDSLLKRDRNLDLCLTPYRVLATGAQEGLVEYVPHAHTIADILASPRYKGVGPANSKILAFFQRHHPVAANDDEGGGGGGGGGPRGGPPRVGPVRPELCGLLCDYPPAGDRGPAPAQHHAVPRWSLLPLGLWVYLGQGPQACGPGPVSIECRHGGWDGGPRESKLWSVQGLLCGGVQWLAAACGAVHWPLDVDGGREPEGLGDGGGHGDERESECEQQWGGGRAGHHQYRRRQQSEPECEHHPHCGPDDHHRGKQQHARPAVCEPGGSVADSDEDGGTV